MADEENQPDEEEFDEEAAAAAAAVAVLAALIADDVAVALAEDNEEHRLSLFTALASQAFTLAYEQAGGTGSSAEEARAYVYSMRPAFGLLDPDGSEAQQDRMVDIIAHSAVSAGTLAAANDNAGPDQDVKFEWKTMRDDRVRELHQAVDGQLRAGGEPFDVGGHPQRYPGHPVGPPEAWINCRCYLVVHDGITAAAEPEKHTGIAMVAKPKNPELVAQEGGLPEDELHVTLGFFGKTDDPELDPELRGRLEQYLSETPLAQHAARVGGVAYMGDDEPQALVLLLEAPELAEARSSLEAYAAPDAKHPHFTPHMTLGYGMKMPESHPTDIDLDHTELWWGEERMTADSLAACACENEALVARDFPTDKRKKMADRGTAMPDGSYPIANVEDLKNAIQAIGRAKDPDAVKAHIRKRAKALGAENLIPESWTASLKDEAATLNSDGSNESLVSAPANTHDAPGWITNPKETQRLRDYWSKGAGAAKIRWGTEGDLTRCAQYLGKYVGPQYAWGTCQNLHHTVFGEFNPESRGRRGGGDPDEVIDMIDAAFTAAANQEEHMDEETITTTAPPAEWFADPGFDAPTPLTITSDGRVLGHLAAWETCHVGITGECVTPPKSTTNYAHFRTGEVVTADGSLVPVGQITMDTGHAGREAGPKDTVAHYDNTGTGVADVSAGEDEFGIWVAGAMRPGVSEEQTYALRATGALSGDWRRIGGNLELVAALAVNVPGFPVPRVEMAASAAGQPLSLVAAAVVTLDANALDADRVAVAVLARLDQREADEKRRVRAEALAASIRGLRASALVDVVR
jgi:2'-5' RNA ligase